jgi:hypothetical protein
MCKMKIKGPFTKKEEESKDCGYKQQGGISKYYNNLYKYVKNLFFFEQYWGLNLRLCTW